MRKPKKLTFDALEQRCMLSANPIISEFMASNNSTILDGNGESSDWIEIYNDGDQAVDLVGYALTDETANLNKWQFPNQLLEPGEFLVVYASGNDTPDLSGALHTNFKLASDGEYLALVSPSGSVISDFGASYPAQVTDKSYGLAFDAASTGVVTPDSASRYWVPSDDSVDGTWTDLAFNDNAWQTGTASIGYDTGGPTSSGNFHSQIQTPVPFGTGAVYVRIPFTIAEAGAALTNLQMKYDDGFVAYLNGTRIASANASASVTHESLATADHPDGQALNYEDFDVSSFSNLLQVGSNTLAIHMLNRSTGSSDLLSVPNLLLATGGLITPNVVGELDAPTPGAVNTNLQASPVTFSRVGGVFTGSFGLEMSSTGPGEVIRYTTDGSLPTANSTLYTGPINVSTTTQFRALAVGAVGQLGGITTEAYTLTSASTSTFTSDLPIIVLENFAQGTPGAGDFEDASFALYDVDESTGRSDLSNPADVTTRIGQHRRGSSTSGNPKTNLRIELRDNYDQDKNIELLGMPSESDWVLYAPYNFDRAMMRNTLMYDLSRQMGQYAARTRFVEVYSNTNDGTLDSSDYMGVYVLMENIKRDDSRVDLNKLNPSENTEPDITGGYILKLDRSDGSPDSSWFTERGIPTLGSSRLVHVEPERIDMTIAQRDYIRGYVQDFEDALYGPNSTDPELGYQAYFDVESSLDHHLLRVLSKEPDGLRLSTFLTKDRNGKLAFGPVWDFDRSAGADNDGRAADPMGWELPDVDFFESDWWGELFDDPNFAQKWVNRWQELRATVLSDANITATVEAQAAQIAEAQVRNFDRWTSVSPNGGAYADPGLSGWEAEVSHYKNWLITRANWMDDQMVPAPSLSPEPGNVAANTVVTLTPSIPGGDVYYTLDGTDPRADGGSLSPSAILYTGPFVVASTTQVTARGSGQIAAGFTSNSSSPNTEQTPKSIDGSVFTKYLNFGKENSGIIITPDSGSSIVRSIQLTTANGSEARDPSSWELYGTNESIESTDHSTGLGENWTLISAGETFMPSQRRTAGPVLSFGNEASYTSYKLMFPTVKNPASADSMEVSEINFFETNDGTGTQLLSAGASTLAVHLTSESVDNQLAAWSSLVSGLFSVEVPADASNLRLAEVHYHPAAATAAELLAAPGSSRTDFEFVELVNTSNDSISLNGVQISEGITFDFTTSSITSLLPQARVLIVKDLAAFTARYGSGFSIAGEYSGKLSDGGEQLVLSDINSAVIHDFEYKDKQDPAWPATPDGDGPSLEVINLFGDYTAGSNWQASANLGGTPGEASGQPGDFDGDQDVDGADFLAWQRGYATAYVAADLTTWQTNYGEANASAMNFEVTMAASFAPPEPVTVVTEQSSTTTLFQATASPVVGLEQVPVTLAWSLNSLQLSEITSADERPVQLVDAVLTGVYEPSRPALLDVPADFVNAEAEESSWARAFDDVYSEQTEIEQSLRSQLLDDLPNVRL